LENVEEQCRELGATFIIILKETELFSNLRVRYLERDRFQEKKMNMADLVDFVSKSIRLLSDSNENLGNMVHLKTDSQPQRFAIQATEASGANQLISNHGLPCVHISFIITDSKEKGSNWKRRQENQMLNHISDTLSKLSKQQTVEVFGIELNSGVIRSLCSLLDFSDKDEFKKSVLEVIARHPRQKKYLVAICDEVFDFVFKKHSTVVILYGLTDNFYKLIL